MVDAERVYRVTIRYYGSVQQYETLQVVAADLREALEETAERFPDGVVESADLVEIRLVNPAE